MSTSLPCHSAGRKGSGGALRITAQIVSSSGASLASRRNSGRSFSASSSGCTMSPDRTCGPSGWSLNSKEVTTPKLPPPPRNAQKRSGCSVSLARTQLAVGRDDVGRDEIVDRQSELAGGPAEAAAERQAGDAGRRVDAGRCREAELLRLPVEIRQRRAGLDAGGPREPDRRGPTSSAKDRSEPAVADRVAGDVVAAAAHRDEKLLVPRELDRLDDVGGAEAARDERRAAVDHRVPDRAARLRSRPLPAGRRSRAACRRAAKRSPRECVLVASSVRMVRSVMFASSCASPFAGSARDLCGFGCQFAASANSFHGGCWPLVHELNRPGIDSELGALRRPQLTLRQKRSWPMSDSSYNQFCPVAMAAEILGARWTLVLLRELVVGSTRFNDLRRGVPRMSPALLSKRLKDLEAAGIVTRSPVGGEPGVLRVPADRGGAGAEAGRSRPSAAGGNDGSISRRRSRSWTPIFSCGTCGATSIPTPMPPTPQHHPGHLHRPSGSAAELVAGRGAGPGGRSVLRRPGLRRRSLSVDRLADHDRDLDGLHYDRAGPRSRGSCSSPAAGSSISSVRQLLRQRCDVRGFKLLPIEVTSKRRAAPAFEPRNWAGWTDPSC